MSVDRSDLPPGLKNDDSLWDEEDSSVETPVAPVIEVKERSHTDATFLELDPSSTDPNRHYRWVRADANNGSVVRHKLKGYRIETLNTGVKPLATPDRRNDSAIAIGDVILMSCDKQEYEERMQSGYRRREAILASTSAETEEMAARKGVKLIQDADHGKETS